MRVRYRRGEAGPLDARVPPLAPRFTFADSSRVTRTCDGARFVTYFFYLDPNWHLRITNDASLTFLFLISHRGLSFNCECDFTRSHIAV